jgi:hypothetical protein
MSLGLTNVATAVTSVPLNTAYDYWFGAVYLPAPPVFPGNVSTTKDNYWINIASYPPTTPPVDTTFYIYRPINWAVAMPPSGWISAWNSNASRSGVTPSNPAYTIFRKCFCLQKGFTQAQIGFRVRADDTIQMWLNTQVQPLLAASWGNWNGNPLSGGTNNQAWFHDGVNCVYALVEDFHGNMGFDLVGSVSANGLLATPAKGTAGSFEPCSCETGHGPAGARTQAVTQDDGDEVIKEIIKLAEARRTAKEKSLYQGKQPQK